MPSKTRTRVSKAYVHYRKSAWGSPKRCGSCAMFHRQSATCDLVEGKISSIDVCDKWVKRAGNQ